MRARSSDLILLLAFCAACLAVVVGAPVPQLVAGSSSTSCSSCVPE